MKFVKYHGLGNDFVIVKAEENPNVPFAQIAEDVCNRHTGIGADGLVILTKLDDDKSFRMQIFNSDGSECEMCGNATRCVAKFLNIKGTINLTTLAGLIRPTLLDSGLVTVDMGVPVIGESLTLQNYYGTNVSMGNPHFVCIVDDLEKVDLTNDGSKLEVDAYFPKKSNIEFVQILSNEKVRMRVWERGCGITMACGTGSCATAVATSAVAKKTASKIEVVLDGGSLFIEYNSEDKHVYMTGESTKVFEGEYYV